MKFLFVYRITLIAVLAVVLPLTLLASSSRSLDKPFRRDWTSADLPMLQDSTSSRKKPSNKPQETQKPSRDDHEERLKEAQRRSIKQVPRSIPKLKPQPVTERIKIQRPQIKGRRN